MKINFTQQEKVSKKLSPSGEKEGGCKKLMVLGGNIVQGVESRSLNPMLAASTVSVMMHLESVGLGVGSGVP